MELTQEIRFQILLFYNIWLYFSSDRLQLEENQKTTKQLDTLASAQTIPISIKSDRCI